MTSNLSVADAFDIHTHLVGLNSQLLPEGSESPGRSTCEVFGLSPINNCGNNGNGYNGCSDTPSSSRSTQVEQAKLSSASSPPTQYYPSPTGHPMVNGGQMVVSGQLKNPTARLNGTYAEGMAVATEVALKPPVQQKGNKPVKVPQYCNSAVKVCRQRRINNHNFCIRHILEDSAAPYKPCEHIRKRGGKDVKCANAVPLNQETNYCTTHLIMFGQIEPKRKKGKEELPSSHVVQNGHGTISKSSGSRQLNGINRQTSVDGLNNFYFDHSNPSATAVSESGIVADSFYIGGVQHGAVNSHHSSVAGAVPTAERKSVKKPSKPRKKKISASADGDLASVYPELASKLNLSNLDRSAAVAQRTLYTPAPGSTSVSYEMSPIRPSSHNFVEPLGLNVSSARPVPFQNGPNPTSFSPAVSSSAAYSNGHAGWNGNADDNGYGIGRSQRANDLVYSPYSQMSFCDTPWSKMSSPCSSLSQETHQPGISSPRSVTSASCRNGDALSSQTSVRLQAESFKQNGPGGSDSADSTAVVEKSIQESPKKVIRLRPNKKKDKMTGVYRKIPAVNRMCGFLDKLEGYNDDLFPLGFEPSSSESEDELEDACRPLFEPLLPTSQSNQEDPSELNLTALRRQLYFERRESKLSKFHLRRVFDRGGVFAAAARHFPNSVACVVRDRTAQPKLKKKRKRRTPSLASQRQRPCCSEISEGHCKAFALPLTNFCADHIKQSVTQQLFQYCSVSGCSRALFDVHNAEPKCTFHAKASQLSDAAALMSAPSSSSQSRAPQSFNSRSVPMDTGSMDIDNFVQMLRPDLSTSKVDELDNKDDTHDESILIDDVAALGFEEQEHILTEMLRMPDDALERILCDQEAGKSSDLVLPTHKSPTSSSNFLTDLPVDAASVNHNWADVEQFLLSEGYHQATADHQSHLAAPR